MNSRIVRDASVYGIVVKTVKQRIGRQGISGGVRNPRRRTPRKLVPVDREGGNGMDGGVNEVA